jgi:hypothetical protein
VDRVGTIASTRVFGTNTGADAEKTMGTNRFFGGATSVGTARTGRTSGTGADTRTIFLFLPTSPVAGASTGKLSSVFSKPGGMVGTVSTTLSRAVTSGKPSNAFFKLSPDILLLKTLIFELLKLKYRPLVETLLRLATLSLKTFPTSTHIREATNVLGTYGPSQNRPEKHSSKLKTSGKTSWKSADPTQKLSQREFRHRLHNHSHKGCGKPPSKVPHICPLIAIDSYSFHRNYRRRLAKTNFASRATD